MLGDSVDGVKLGVVLGTAVLGHAEGKVVPGEPDPGWVVWG